MKRRFLAIITLIFLAFFVLTHQPSYILIQSTSGSFKIKTELAHDNESRRIGLMGRGYLQDGRGMLFLYDKPLHPVMWMKDMKISLDIVFIDENQIVSHIEKNVPPCYEPNDSNCLRYRADEASVMVLELPAGYTEKKGIKEGDRIDLFL